jgi:D-alanyl-lipoteichoic acid acyltransferase DltB (MBOAT superfamily)
MSILEISILTVAALIIGWIPRPQVRAHLLLLASILVVYWLQSRSVEIYSITYWLPTLTVILVALSWVFTASPEIRSLKTNWPGVLLVVATILAIDLTRYFGKANPVFPDMSTPNPLNVFLVIALVFLTAFIITRIAFLKRFSLPVTLLVILAAFVIIKLPALDKILHKIISKATGNPQNIKDTFVWLGFSYFAFRIIHTIRDRQKGLLPAVTLTEYGVYVLFFPSFVAGPIDRIERFIRDLRAPAPLTDADWFFAGRRLLVGLFKKFVVADALALFALDPKILPQIQSTGWFWVLLYAYTFQIYFDFSGYSDIAIGIARLVGIKLPENFNAPYLKPNLTQFWNNWHITLTQWFRAYFFNPLQRWLRSYPTGTMSRAPIPTWLLILVLQLSTMILIGLWHGILLNFVLWGAWHGLGLFVHNRWREAMAARVSAWANTPLRTNVLNIAGILLTFHYVAIGWVFFVLPANQIPPAIRLLLGLHS